MPKNKKDVWNKWKGDMYSPTSGPAPQIFSSPGTGRYGWGSSESAPLGADPAGRDQLAQLVLLRQELDSARNSGDPNAMLNVTRQLEAMGMDPKHVISVSDDLARRSARPFHSYFSTFPTDGREGFVQAGLPEGTIRQRGQQALDYEEKYGEADPLEDTMAKNRRYHRNKK